MNPVHIGIDETFYSSLHVAIINNLNVFVRRKFTGKLEEP